MAPARDPAAFARLRELFHAAVDLPPSEQAQFLAALTADDRTYLAELAELLAANLQTGEPAAALAAESRELLAEADFTGRRLGVWQLESLIGEGGMGAVYRAERADGVVRQRAAVKLVHPTLASARLHQRFLAERQVLATLEHPGIARLLDAGTSEEGHPYLVMEYVEGSDLERHCAERQLGLDQRLTLFRGVCAAVEYAHRNLVVHSDIKPGNVLVTPDGQVKLLDFGIARLLGTQGQEVTQAGGLRLTPAFASPEQLAGGPVTTATDVYSLGVLLYRLLTGRHPYGLAGLPLPAVARTVTEEPPQPPSSAVRQTPPAEGPSEAADSDASLRPPLRPRALARALAGDLDTIVLTALRKEPDRRYASVAAMAEDVRRHQQVLPVLARGESLRYRAGKFFRRNRLATIASAVAILSLAAGAGIALWQAREAMRERDRARTEARNAEEMNRLLRATLTSADPVRGEGREVKVAALLAGASSRLGTQLTGQPGLEGNLRETLGETYRNLGLLAEAESEFRRAVALHGRAGDEQSAARARVLRAVALRDQGKLPAAEADLHLALKVLRRNDPTPATAQALDALLVTLRHQGRHDEAIAAGEEAVTLLRTRFPGERAALASTLNNLALCFGEQGKFVPAERLHREAVALIRRERGPRHPQTAEAVANLAGVIDMQGRLAEAEPLYREAMETQEALLGEEHPDFLRTLTSYANLLWLMHRPADAEPHARRARDVATKALGPDHPLAAYAENILGGILLDVNQPREAEAVIRSSLAKRRRMLPAGHWLIASSQSNLGAALIALGRFDEARRELREAHATLLADRGPEHEKTKLTAARLAELDRASRKPAGRPPV